MARILALGVFVAAACAPGPDASEGGGSVADGPGDSGMGGGGSDGGPDLDTAVEEVPGSGGGGGGDKLANGCSDLYDPDVLQTFELEFTADAWSDLRSACSSYSLRYVPVRFTTGGETVDAHVRLKGNWSWSCDKMQFVVSFHEDDPDARFHGLRKTVLDAPWYDHTLLHERLAYPQFEARGLPFSCANSARLYIDGEYYGLYAHLERLDREYLERHYDEPDGNLYQGGTELKTNEDEADTSRLTALQAAVHDVDALAELVDLDQAVSEWATEAMIPAMDNYWAGVEINYYLYDHPSEGFHFLPYDLDISFGDSAYSDGTLIWPGSATVDPISYEHTGWKKEALVRTVLADPHWCSRFVEELEAARAVYDPASLEAQVDAWDAQIHDALAEDPNRTFSMARHDAAEEQLRAFFTERADFVDGWLAEGGHCPGG